MKTPFGNFLKKALFKKVFFVVVLAGAVLGGLMNGRAVYVWFGNDIFAYLLGTIYAVLGILVLFQNKVMEKWKNKRLEMVIGIYSCFYIYDFMGLLLWVILSYLFSISDTFWAAGVCLVDFFAVALVTGGYLYAKQIKCKPYTVYLGMKGEMCHIVMLSDIHLGVFVGEEHMRRIVEKVNRLQADLVVICGDIIDVNNHILEDDGELERISSLFREIRAKNGVFAVLGNHDPQITNEKFQHFLKSSHIQLLHNEVIQVSGLNLIGRTDPSNNERSPIEILWKKVDSSKLSVVLDHNPNYISESAKCGADLVLSGHTHKGQFIPVTYFTKLANEKHCFYGKERFGKTQAIISSGAGFFQLPVRIGTSNEIVDIHIM